MIKASFVSVWDGGTQIVSPCRFNDVTKDVEEIESVEVGESVDVLEDEFVLLPDGTEVRDFNIAE